MKITFRDNQYQTLEACYKANKDIAKVSLYIFKKRMGQGLSVEDALLIPNDRHDISFRGSHTVEGVEYLNLPAIARAYGMKEMTVYKRHHRGLRGDELVPPKLRKDYVPPEPKKSSYQVEIGGVTYKSIAEALRSLGIKKSTYTNRRRTGRTPEECLEIVPFVNRRTLQAQRFEMNGEHLTIKEMVERFGIPFDALYYRLKKAGLTAKEAVTKKPKRKAKESKIQD